MERALPKSVIGVFNDQENVEKTISALGAVGIDPKEMSVVMKNKKEAGKLGTNTETEMSEGALTGAKTGAIIGSFAGLLVGTILPGTSGMFVAGPLSALIGVSGVVASTMGGAITGAMAGGVMGMLTGLGLSFEEAKLYEAYAEKGMILLVVPVEGKKTGGVIDIFTLYNAVDTKVLSDGDAPAHIQESLEGQNLTEKAMYDKPDPDPYQAILGNKGGAKEEEKTIKHNEEVIKHEREV